MAEGKELHELTPATQATDEDLMLLQQNGIAKNISIKKLLARLVKTINGKAPDENGNVVVEGGEISDEQVNSLIKTATEDRFSRLEESVQDILDEMNYKNISITAFSCPGAGTYEIGQSVAAPTITWTLNKEPASQTMAVTGQSAETLDVEARSKSYTGSITSNKTYTLTVKGQKGETSTKSGSYTFYKGVYYGVVEDGAAINSAAVLKLTRELRGNKSITFTANAGATQRIAYAFPTAYTGTPVFNVGGFEGGFSKVSTFQFTNASDHTESYDVWLSDNVGLGNTTVKVT